MPRSASPATHMDVTIGIDQQLDDRLERGGVDGIEGGLDVRQLCGPVALDRRVAAQLADALGRRSQLAGEVVLDRSLERAESVEAELGGQPHDGGGPRRRRFGEVGDGAESDQLGSGEDDFGDPTFGRREIGSGPPDSLDHLHVGHPWKP